MTGETTYRLYIERSTLVPGIVHQHVQDSAAPPMWDLPTAAESSEGDDEKEDDATEDNKEAEGFWEEVWLENGRRKWVHTGSKGETLVDPYH